MISEVEFPQAARKPGQCSARAFQIQLGTVNIGVLYAKEPAMRDGTLAIHVSISKSQFGVPIKVTNSDVQDVEQLVLNAGLEWPAEYDLEMFTVGPFKDTGVHVWQADYTKDIESRRGE